MEGKNIVAVSVKDYKNLYEKNELRVLKDYTIFLIRGEGQKAPEEGEFEDIVVTDCNDGQCIRSAIKDHLDTEDIGNHLLVFYGKNLPQINAAPIDGQQQQHKQTKPHNQKKHPTQKHKNNKANRKSKKLPKYLEIMFRPKILKIKIQSVHQIRKEKVLLQNKWGLR